MARTRRRSIQQAVWLLGLLLVLVFVPGLAHATPGSSLRRADRASEIEQRLIAPCCWTQTLDVHDSEISTALRIELRDRLSRGESDLSIEDDLASRYGERIRAVPRKSQIRSLAPLLVGLVMTVSLLVLLWVVRRGSAPISLRADWLASPSQDKDPYDLALERELARENRRS